MKVPRYVLNRILDVAINLLLSGLAADLLYLFFAGRWIEPVTVIKVSEIVSLCAIFLLGIIRALRYIRKLGGETV